MIHLDRQVNSIGRCKIYFVNCISGTFVKRQNIYQRCLASCAASAGCACFYCLLIAQVKHKQSNAHRHAYAMHLPQHQRHEQHQHQLELELCLSGCQSVCLPLRLLALLENVIRVEALGGQLSSDATDIASSSASASGECQTRGGWATVTRWARCKHRLGWAWGLLFFGCSFACTHALLTHSAHMQIFADADAVITYLLERKPASIISCGRGKVPLHSTIHGTFVWPPKWRQITSMASLLVIRLHASVYLCECVCVCVWVCVCVSLTAIGNCI